MKKILLSLILGCVLPLAIFAEGIPAERLIQLGTNAFQQRAHQPATVKTVDFLVEEGDTLVAILNFQNGGFIIMAADDAFAPVIGYSIENDFPLQNSAPAALYWVNGYKNMVAQVKKQHLTATEDVARQWGELETPMFRGNRSVVVPALVSAIWNQSQYYNDLCPADADSPYGYGGRVPCGCVALAMAMVIHYYRYPATGQGSHSYHSNYGYHSVNYGQQTYNYNVMPFAVNKKNNDVAKLIYHCGIAVEMGYAPEGSGAQTEDTRYGLVNYYKYDDEAEHVNRSGGWWGGNGYDDAGWINLLKGDLDNHWPIIYSGYGEEGGHAFLCDGYDSDNNFHFNFGWGGANNGYYTVASNNDNAVGGFSSYQDIVHKVHPPMNIYPVYCQNVEVNASAGSLEDGSGHLDYQNNTNCTYIIRPENGKSVTITPVSLDIEEDHDFLRIYDGDPNNGGNLLKEYTGTTFNPTESAYSSTGVAYLVFTSDGAGTASGWRFRFTAKRYVVCNTTTNLTDISGTVTDGSNDENYAWDANCSWNITPSNATSVTLHFTQFDFSNEDCVTVYNGTDASTASVLWQFTGSNPPTNIVSNTGKMKIVMTSDNYVERAGFSANWTSNGYEDPEDPEDPESGVENHEELYFEIYPNPANDKLNVVIPNALRDGQLRITDMNGRVIMMRNISEIGLEGQIGTSELATGVYMVTLSNASEIITKKLIINR